MLMLTCFSGRRGCIHSFVFLFLLGMQLRPLLATAQPGKIDTGFHRAVVVQSNALSPIGAIDQQPDGKILIGGAFDSIDGIHVSFLARLYNDGTVDESLHRLDLVASNVRSIRVLTDGKILVGGGGWFQQGISQRYYLARLFPDGSLDASFNANSLLLGSVNQIHFEASGKIVAISDASGGINRLNADGSPDPTFQPGSGAYGTARSLAALPGGKYFLAGDFSYYNFEARGRFAWLNANGTLDASIPPRGEGANAGLFAAAAQPDGKVLIGGDFTTVHGIARKGIARLLPDDSVDPTFTTGAGFSGSVRCVKVLANGKILVAGDFTAYQGVPRARIALLHADGSLDTSFDPGPGADQVIQALLVQPDGKILIGGNFLSYAGLPVFRYARVTGDGYAAVPAPATAFFCAGASASVPFVVTNTFQDGNLFTAQLSDASGSFVNAVPIGTLAGTGSGVLPVTIPVNIPAGTGYRMRILSSLPVSTGAANALDLTINAVPSLALSYPGSPFCQAVGSVLPQLAGATGGAYSAGSGLALDPLSGSVDLAASVPGSYTVRYRLVAGACVAEAFTAIALRPAVLLASVPNSAICAGEVVATPVLGVVPGLGYTWTNDNPTIGLPASGMGMVPSFVAQNTTGGVLAARIQVQPQGGTECPLKPVAYSISVKPLPTVNLPPGQQLCAGTAAAPTVFSGSLPGTVFLWSNTNPSIGIAAGGAGSLPSFMALNDANMLQTAGITVTPLLNGCSGAPATCFITVSPAVVSIGYSQTDFCPEGQAFVQRVGSGGGSYATVPAGLSLNGATGTVQLGQSVPGTYQVTYTVIASGGCGSQASTQVRIVPRGVVNPVPNQVYCNGMVTAPLSFTGTATTFHWTNDNPGIGLDASGTGNIPAFTAANPGPAPRYAYVRVVPDGDGLNYCPGKAMGFRYQVNACNGVTQFAGDGSASGTLRAALSLSPNPAGEQLRIQVSTPSRLAVEIRDAYGRAVVPKRAFSTNEILLSLNGIYPGTYFALVSDLASGNQATLSFLHF